MLPREHRLTSGRDFRAVTRRGARAGGDHMVVSVLTSAQTARPHGGTAETAGEVLPASSTSWACGFVVSKKVGNAVARHRTQRRLRHLAAELIPDVAARMPDDQTSPNAGPHLDVVVRALPGITAASHPAVREDFSRALTRAMRKAAKRAAPRQLPADTAGASGRDRPQRKGASRVGPAQ